MRKIAGILGLSLAALMILTACQIGAPEPTPTPAPTATQKPTPVPTPTPAPTPTPITRTGGWLDTITMIMVDPAEAVSQVASGGLDLYAGLLEGLNWSAIESAGLLSAPAYNRFYDITLNPAPIDNENKGQLNPFADAAIRESLNLLVDRAALVEQVLSGAGQPKYVPLTAALADAVRYDADIQAVAQEYAYDAQACRQVVTERMQAMGAVLEEGLWTYGGKPVTLVFLIRNDDEACNGIGDALSDELEDLGFTVDRQYVTAQEAADIWLGTDPAGGKWHLATGCWRLSSQAGMDSRDTGSNFEFYLSSRSVMSYYPLWRYYTVDETLDDVFTALARKDYHTAEERDELFRQAIAGSVELSYRIFVVDAAATGCWSEAVSTASDPAAGVAASQMTPYVLRFTDVEGGDLSWGAASLFGGAVNPIGGTRDIDDLAAVNFTWDRALLIDPATGLQTAQRIASAKLEVRGDLPVEKAAESSWLTLEKTGESIEVPADAYFDWDAENEVWLTVGDEYPQGLTALTRCTVVYGDELADVRWHDGSALDVADFMMAMIVRFDRTNAGSDIYDGAAAEQMEAFTGSFKGFRIVSEQPLTIEYYTDAYEPDAENCVTALWPEGDGGQAAWHLLALCNRVDASGEGAYSQTKAIETKGEWINLISGTSLELLAAACQQAIDEEYIPYAATMGEYITAADAAARYRSLLDFYETHGHFLVGTGPYILDSVDTEAGTCTLVNNGDYVDICDRWTRE